MGRAVVFTFITFGLTFVVSMLVAVMIKVIGTVVKRRSAPRPPSLPSAAKIAKKE